MKLKVFDWSGLDYFLINFMLPIKLPLLER